MRFLEVQRTLGLMLLLFSLAMLPPIIVNIVYKEAAMAPFWAGFLIVISAGFVLWYPVRNVRYELELRDGFIIVALFWVALSVTASVPLLFVDTPHLSVVDAIFESVSGLTTTGATVITGLDSLPHSILFYRQMLQWFGGMGIIVLAVAILPLLGIGGMQLYRAETSGLVKDHKLTPHITETAKALWYLYVALTIVCALAYWASGMSGFDAIVHSFSTVAIGGFSSHDSSIGYYSSLQVELVAIVFMVIAGINFRLHFTAWRNHNLDSYRFDSELKVYLVLLVCLSLITSAYLYFSGTFDTPATALRHGVFHSVSLSTTTGYTTTYFHIWPSLLPLLLLLASFIGGCAGSTGGGLKVIRVILLYKQAKREITLLMHPNAQVLIKIGRVLMPNRVINAVWGFFAIYVATFSLILLLLMGTGLDQVSAFSAVAACINNLGPGLGKVAHHYGAINDAAKWILCLAMLLGRLEIFTLLVILSPAFWRS